MGWLRNKVIDLIITSLLLEPAAWGIGKLLDRYAESLPSFMRSALQRVEAMTDWIPPGLFFGIAIGASIAFVMLRGWRTPRQPTNSKDQGASFAIEDQKRLANRLRAYLKPTSHVDFKFASLKQMELTETIEAIFKMAAWETNYWNIPVEGQRSVHLEGIEVSGYNKFLVSAIASELRDAGLPAIRSKVEPVESPMNAERWASLENRLRITVGHH